MNGNPTPSPRRFSDIRTASQRRSGPDEALLAEILARAETVEYGGPVPADAVTSPGPERAEAPVVGKPRRRRTIVRILVPAAAVFALAAVSVGGYLLVRGDEIRGIVLGESTEGMRETVSAIESLKSADFTASADGFDRAYESFTRASEALGDAGNTLAKVAGVVPGLSSVSSGQAMIESAQHLTKAGTLLSSALAEATSTASESSSTLLDILERMDGASEAAATELEAAEKSLARVDPADVPDDRREAFLALRARLPEARLLLVRYHEHGRLVRDLLGSNGERLYLFLFQNNHEMRPTGGFIGSYGLLKVSEGEIRSFFIDGIFNPDGQLRRNVIPPAPIRKISVGWSLHDSNWWPDFPRSARKAVEFYELSGGPTVDGVVTLTPQVIVELLAVTGPIPMPEYGVTISADNFMAAVQEEVEVNYDRERNEPKRILADLAPVLLDRLMDSADVMAALSALSRGLSEKHIILFSSDEEIQALIDDLGWSGALTRTDSDYLAVIHSNINGYKTDGVIEERIDHKAEIAADGSVIDTVRITRDHRGGQTPYEWWNKVNADYLRVYVPLGSELITARGQTWEFPPDPVDYAALGFEHDPDVSADEATQSVRDDGTRISTESGKTVFGNWVYVSPGESVTVEYRYRLPFRVPLDGDGVDSYALVAQKQPGSLGSDFRTTLSYPPDIYLPVWMSEGVSREPGRISLRTALTTDAYLGAAFIPSR